MEMARDSADEERQAGSEDSGEEEEALSLCDLPVNLIKEENPSRKNEEEQEGKCQGTETSEEDFNFSQCCGTGGDSVTKQEMCAADDIFFQGQILPLRLSVSSETGLTKFRQDSINQNRSLSRSQSIDHSGFTSTFSSRSSSSRSQHSSSSASSMNASTERISKPIRIQDQYFHNFPSPKPQIRLSNASLRNALNNRNRKSSAWEFFRLGLVRAPEIEFQDLKYRSSVSRNSSSSSSSSNSNSCIIKSRSSSHGKNAEKQRKERNLWSGCSCSVSAAKPIQLSSIVVKSKNNSGAKCDKDGGNEGEKKQKEVKMKKKNEEKKKGKQSMSHHRTFEWIKELSHASLVDHEQGHGVNS